MRVVTVAGIAVAILALVAAPGVAQSGASKASPPAKTPLAPGPPSSAAPGGPAAHEERARAGPTKWGAVRRAGDCAVQAGGGAGRQGERRFRRDTGGGE